jgi:hypothetical protein
MHYWQKTYGISTWTQAVRDSAWACAGAGCFEGAFIPL